MSESMGDDLSRQQVLADFGIEALSSSNLDEILGGACVLVADGLDESLAKIVEDRPDSERLYIRAEHGFGLEEADKWIGRGRASSAGHALLTGTPTISNHADTDDRFVRAHFIKKHRVMSVANVPIPDTLGGPGIWWGVLEVDSCNYGAFSDSDVTFLRLYANLLAAAIARIRAREELEEALGEKQRLLQELQHRIKNNLATVTSLIRMQARQAKSEEAKKQLDAIGRRVETLRLVHERLYSRQGTETIALKDYLDELVRNLAGFHGSDAEKVVIDTRFEDAAIVADKAIPIGLIVNEFITNAIKYAFPDGKGVIACTLELNGGEAHLVLSDDGVGLPDDFATSGGTGTTIVNGLARQLGGAAGWSSVPGEGTKLTIGFPLR